MSNEERRHEPSPDDDRTRGPAGRAESRTSASSEVYSPGEPAKASSVRADAWLPWYGLLPVFLLIAVAVVQIGVTHSSTLTPWKGGGFGMFAVIDGVSNRRIRLVAVGKNEERAVPVPRDLAPLARATGGRPTRERLQRLADVVAARMARNPRARGVVAVRAEVWRGTFDGERSRLVMTPWLVQSAAVPRPGDGAQLEGVSVRRRGGSAGASGAPP